MGGKITLEDLARMVAEGFNDMGVQFKGLRQELKADIARLEIRLDQAAWRIDVEHLDKRVTRVENKVGIR